MSHSSCGRECTSAHAPVCEQRKCKETRGMSWQAAAELGSRDSTRHASNAEQAAKPHLAAAKRGQAQQRQLRAFDVNQPARQRVPGARQTQLRRPLCE
jgi:hypothetical protein